MLNRNITNNFDFNINKYFYQTLKNGFLSMINILSLYYNICEKVKRYFKLRNLVKKTLCLAPSGQKTAPFFAHTSIEGLQKA